MKKSIALSIAISALFLSACANGPCRQLRQPQLAAGQTEAASTSTTAAASPTSTTSTLPPAPGASPAPLKNPKTAPGAIVGPSTGGPVTKPQPNGPANGPATGSVFIFKADGSLQCGEAKGLAAEEMEKELKGIKVLSREKRSDGMMHIQVCGSPTGMINVYEIPAAALPDAEKRGFKLLPRT